VEGGAAKGEPIRRTKLRLSQSNNEILQKELVALKIAKVSPGLGQTFTLPFSGKLAPSALHFSSGFLAQQAAHGLKSPPKRMQK